MLTACARVCSPLTLLIVLALLGVSRGDLLHAQEAKASIAVIAIDSANQIPLGGSRVAIQSLAVDSAHAALNTSRFADADGRVMFVRLDSGAYMIRVRRLGFAPRDTVIRVTGPDLARQVYVGMRQLRFTLANVTVHGDAECVEPGLVVHDPESDVGVVLGAVAENAEREKTLRGRYPFTYVLERTDWYSQTHSSARFGVKTDTLQYRGDAFSPYHVGEVVVPDPGPDGQPTNRKIFRIPTLVDLADTTFLKTHCFDYEGKRGNGNDAVAVVTFKPLSSIMHPDASGEILLDAKTLLLKRAAFSLTHPDSVSDGLGFTVSTSYRLLAPGLAIMDEITSNQILPQKSLRFTERQKLISLHFLGASVPGYVPWAEDRQGARAFGLFHIARPLRDRFATLNEAVRKEREYPLDRVADRRASRSGPYAAFRTTTLLLDKEELR